MGRPGQKQYRLEVSASEVTAVAALSTQELNNRVAMGVTPERSYAQAIPPDHRRRFAQFFTPPKIASLMAEWALERGASSLLDPAVGMGVLVRAARAQRPALDVTVFEKDPTILRAYLSTQPDLHNLEVFFEDFLTAELQSNFDAVLMNPPYLRHHDLAYDFDIFTFFSTKYGVPISKLSNSYLLFTLKAVSALKPGGRAAIIIPTEWMNANFGSAMKSYLVNRNVLKELIYFSNCSDVFDDALTTASVLLIESN